MHGYWLQGGTLTFDYQPLYRWISGLLHVVFGDSSVGELYLDAAALLAGALLAFALAKLASGFREGLVAAASTLATFTLGTIWYFPGRGLSETVAAGFAFLAAFFLLRARIGRASSAAAAGACAVLMFYTRLNHALFAGFLVALLLPISARIGPGAFRRMAAAIRPSAAAIYGGVFTTGVALFALRTWWYTGVFSVLYGTSLRNNDTGLRPSTILTLDPWRRILHSLSALAWMNEPPRLDARALMVIGGLLVAAGAILQVPRMRTVPASLVAVIVGATASAFFVHTHNYPGRMSIHLVPFAAAAVAIAGGRMWHPR
jgi:hypothetical protein